MTIAFYVHLRFMRLIFHLIGAPAFGLMSSADLRFLSFLFLFLLDLRGLKSIGMGLGGIVVAVVVIRRRERRYISSVIIKCGHMVVE